MKSQVYPTLLKARGRVLLMTAVIDLFKAKDSGYDLENWNSFSRRFKRVTYQTHSTENPRPLVLAKILEHVKSLSFSILVAKVYKN